MFLAFLVAVCFATMLLIGFFPWMIRGGDKARERPGSVAAGYILMLTLAIFTNTYTIERTGSDLRAALLWNIILGSIIMTFWTLDTLFNLWSRDPN
jgi:hypothetical protein